MRKLFWFWLATMWVVSCGPQHPNMPVPQPPITYNVGCVVYDQDTKQPIRGAECQDGDFHAETNQDGYYLFMNVPCGPNSGCARVMHATKDGYVPGFTNYKNNAHQNIFVGLKANAPIWPQPESRAPLTLEPNGPQGLICHHDGIVNIPSGPDKRFWRGDAWGVTVPNLPFVNGGSSKHRERVLTWFFDRYPTSWRQEILNAYRRRGYTHFVLSWPDSRDGAGQSINSFVSTALQVKQAIPYVAVFLTSKVYDPSNATADVRMGSVVPVVDALTAAGAVDILVVGWELNLWNEPHRLQDFIDALHNRYPNTELWVHFSTYVTSWQFPGEPRAAFWTRNVGKVTGLLYQGNQNDSCGEMQAHFNDAQVDASGLRAAGATLIPWELVASNEFDGDHPNEDDANARSWEVMNTPGPILSSGFGNGARLPNGNPTLGAYPR